MKDVREILELGFALVPAYKNAMSDGKIGVTDLGVVLGLMPLIGPASEGAGGAMAQWKAATQEQRSIEIAWMRKTFDIADDKLEAKIEACLAMFYHCGVLFSK